MSDQASSAFLGSRAEQRGRHDLWPTAVSSGDQLVAERLTHLGAEHALSMPVLLIRAVRGCGGTVVACRAAARCSGCRRARAVIGWCVNRARSVQLRRAKTREAALRDARQMMEFARGGTVEVYDEAPDATHPRGEQRHRRRAGRTEASVVDDHQAAEVGLPDRRSLGRRLPGAGMAVGGALVRPHPGDRLRSAGRLLSGLWLPPGPVPTSEAAVLTEASGNAPLVARGPSPGATSIRCRQKQSARGPGRGWLPAWLWCCPQHSRHERTICIGSRAKAAC